MPADLEIKPVEKRSLFPLYKTFLRNLENAEVLKLTPKKIENTKLLITAIERMHPEYIKKLQEENKSK